LFAEGSLTRVSADCIYEINNNNSEVCNMKLYEYSNYVVHAEDAQNVILQGLAIYSKREEQTIP